LREKVEKKKGVKLKLRVERRKERVKLKVERERKVESQIVRQYLF
jgi:hypothetical protein